MLVANNFAFQKLDEIPRSTFQVSILSQETRPLEYTVSPWLMRLLVQGKIRISQIYFQLVSIFLHFAQTHPSDFCEYVFSKISPKISAMKELAPKLH